MTINDIDNNILSLMSVKNGENEILNIEELDKNITSCRNKFKFKLKVLHSKQKYYY